MLASGVAAGNAVKAAMATGLAAQVGLGFAGGVAGGFAGGFSGGTIGGLASGQSWGEALGSGLEAGLTGAAVGGVLGAGLPLLFRGLSALRAMGARLRGGAHGSSERGFGAIGLDKLPSGPESSQLRAMYLKEVGSKMFRVKLAIYNRLARLAGGRVVTVKELVEQLSANTEFRTANILTSNINRVGQKFVIGGSVRAGYLPRTIMHHELLHMSQFLRAPNISTSLLHEIGPAFIGTPEIFGGAALAAVGGIYSAAR